MADVTVGFLIFNLCTDMEMLAIVSPCFGEHLLTIKPSGIGENVAHIDSDSIITGLD